jgi:hypothetical protein
LASAVRCEDLRRPHDIGAQQDRAAVALGDRRFVGQDRGGVAAARLAEIGDHVVDADRDVLADPLAALVRQGILDRLQPLHPPPQRIGLHAPVAKDAQGIESARAEQLVVIGLVCADLRVQIPEAAGDPGGVAGFIIVREQVARAVAQIAGESGVVGLHRGGGVVEQSVRLHHLVGISDRIGRRVEMRAVGPVGEHLQAAAETRVQSVEHRMAAQRIDVLAKARPVLAAQDRAGVAELGTPVGMGGKIGVEFGLGEIPGIDVLARRCVVDPHERLAAIVERSRDRTLEQAVERGEVARLGIVRLGEGRRDRDGVAMPLHLVDALEDAADFDEPGDRGPLAGAEMRQIGRQAGGFGPVEDLADLRRRPGGDLGPAPARRHRLGRSDPGRGRAFGGRSRRRAGGRGEKESERPDFDHGPGLAAAGAAVKPASRRRRYARPR